ncbi:MAG TPA: ATP-binding protein [Opitutaceae bacterium]|jgi:signal transduction histidine kinase|nr:ATP-binding protein [Opitutaceae bacterium]
MKPFSHWPLAAKLRAIITCTCLVTVAATCFVWVLYERHTVRAQIPPAQVVRARIIADNLSAALAFNAPHDADELLGALKLDPHISWAVVFDAEGRPFARYLSRPGLNPELPAAARGREGYAYHPGRLTIWTPITAGNERLGTLVAERDLGDVNRRLATIPLIALGGMIFAGIAAYWLASLLQRLISNPILDLARVAGEVTQRKDYSLRAHRTSEDEIGRLTDAFNSMLGTIGSTLAANARLFEQVRRHADELELRVKERTVELEYANEELEAFGSSVSHDLRGPLRYIDGYAQAVLEDGTTQLSAESREYLRKIVDRAARMHTLINVLLEFSRLNRQALQPERLDLAQLAAEVFAELKAENPDRDLRLKLVGPVPASQADRLLGRQVMVNLLSNAIKYTRGRAPAVIEIGGRLVDAEVEYFVRDNGVGFDPARADKLFTAFERLHDPRQYEGIGVGLATVKRIVQRHGGKIRAESVLNVGTTFYFTFPAYRHDV